jgi:hypothetical protein
LRNHALWHLRPSIQQRFRGSHTLVLETSLADLSLGTGGVVALAAASIATRVAASAA